MAGPALAETSHDEGAWVNLTGHGRSGRVVYFLEIQPRIGSGVSELDQLLIRPAVGLKLSDAVSVYQGYARVRTRQDGADTDEDRSFQQLGWTIGGTGRVDLSSRTRLEQRWRSDGDDMGWRLREMLRLEVPLTARDKGVAAVASVEGFFNLDDTDWGARDGFDRVRSFVGLGLPIGGRSTVEMGYLNQTVNERIGTSMDHVLSVNVTLRP